MGVFLAIFWGIILFSFLIFIHEGGHYLAARLFGVRVLEFFIGFPSKLRLSWQSKKRGTRFGVTAFLFGGYAAIAGMDLGKQNPNLSLALALVNSRGRISVKEAAYAMNISYSEALKMLLTLKNWGSINADDTATPTQTADVLLDVSPDQQAEFAALDEQAYKENLPLVFETAARDADGKTVFDKPDFSKPGATKQGEPFFPDMSADEFLAQEKLHTYSGLSAPKRIFVLVAGVLVNLLFAIALFVVVFMASGIGQIENNIAQVMEDSPAQVGGITQGDSIVKIGSHDITTWDDLNAALDDVREKGDTTVVYDHDGEQKEFTVSLGKDEKLGVVPTVVQKRLGFIDAVKMSGKYTLLTGQAVLNLLNPSHMKETLDNSTSVVGIAVLAKDAAQAGFMPLVTLAAAISLSLGMMNLIPIPPLDGGKVVIELIQGITRRPISEKVQIGVSYFGVALFLLLFIYLLGQDVLRLVFPG